VTDIKMLSGGTLAFLGDAIWSLYVRDYLVNLGYNRPNDLQVKSVKMVSAKAQKMFFDSLNESNFFTEDELYYFKRGRNFSSKTTPKNTDVGTYHYSTGFEALVGYLYLEKQNERIDEIFNRAKEMVKV